MKTITRLEVLGLIVALPLGLQAAESGAAHASEETYTGTLTSVNPQHNMIKVSGMLFTKTFNVGKDCAMSTVDRLSPTLSDLQTGEKVDVRYQNVDGVLVADSVAERSLRYDGALKGVDQKAGTVTMAEAPLIKPFRSPEKFRIADDCTVALPNGREGTFAELQPGDQISVIYEVPNGSPVAYRIMERSSTELGSIDAIDLNARTVKAKEMFGEKKFDLGDDCQIFVNGEKPGHLRDLMLGKEYKLTYENVNGVNVLDRIAPAQATHAAETASR